MPAPKAGPSARSEGDDALLGEAGGSEIEDERLELMFTCCHPSLPLEGRVALTLRALAGLTTAEIAHAFFEHATDQGGPWGSEKRVGAVRE